MMDELERVLEDMPEDEHDGFHEEKSLPRGGREPALAKILRHHKDVYRQILLYIERGAYDYIAAEALGISCETWGRWMRKGAKARTGVYRRFYQDVIRAQGNARLEAELQVKRDDPKFWLRTGPGRTKPGRPGWTDSVTISGDPDQPLHVEHEHIGTVRVEAGLNVQDLAKTLLVMEELGLVTRTSHLGQSVIDASAVQHVEPQEDGSDVFDDEPEPSNRGYVPELDGEGAQEGNGNGRPDKGSV